MPVINHEDVFNHRWKAFSEVLDVRRMREQSDTFRMSGGRTGPRSGSMPTVSHMDANASQSL